MLCPRASNCIPGRPTAIRLALEPSENATGSVHARTEAITTVVDKVAGLTNQPG
jgi:hypothetical protein